MTLSYAILLGFPTGYTEILGEIFFLDKLQAV